MVNRFFLNPWALALITMAGGVVLLYILKLKRVKVRIGSTVLWEREVHDFKANAPWQRLRWNILMLLQIIAIILLALALARPFLFGTALLGGRTALVVDTSASMLATDEAPDRLGAALAAARASIDDLRQNDEVMLIAAGPSPRILTSFTKDKSAAREALRTVREEAGGEADLNAALRLVSSVAAGSGTRVVIFSDGDVPDLDPFATTDLRISFYPIGKEGGNLAIVGAGARRNPFSTEYELFLALHNFYPGPRTFDLSLSQGGNVFDAREVELNAGQRREIVVGNLAYSPEPITAELDLKDTLADDNRAFFKLPEKTRYRIALRTSRDSYLLTKLLASIPDIVLGESKSGDASDKVDIWIVDGDAPCPADPAAAYMFFNTTQHPYLPVIPGAEVSLDFTANPPVIPTVTGLDRGHPLLRYANLGDLRLQTVRQVSLQLWARTIVDGSEGPLIVEGEREGQHTLYFAFDLHNSDLPLRAAFPIMMINAINYLGSIGAPAAGQCIAAGARVDLVAPLDSASVRVQPPAGKPYTLALGTRDFTLSRTTQVGLYELVYSSQSGTELGRTVLPVSLVSDEESNIAPAQSLKVKGVAEELGQTGGEPQDIAGTKEVRVNREFFTWLILAALALLAFEWWLYHRRAL